MTRGSAPTIVQLSPAVGSAAGRRLAAPRSSGRAGWTAWRDRDADPPEAVGLERQPGRQLAPGAPAVRGLVEPAARAAEGPVLPRTLARFPQGRTVSGFDGSRTTSTPPVSDRGTALSRTSCRHRPTGTAPAPRSARTGARGPRRTSDRASGDRRRSAESAGRRAGPGASTCARRRPNGRCHRRPTSLDVGGPPLPTAIDVRVRRERWRWRRSIRSAARRRSGARCGRNQSFSHAAVDRADVEHIGPLGYACRGFGASSAMWPYHAVAQRARRSCHDVGTSACAALYPARRGVPGWRCVSWTGQGAGGHRVACPSEHRRERQREQPGIGAVVHGRRSHSTRAVRRARARRSGIDACRTGFPPISVPKVARVWELELEVGR